MINTRTTEFRIEVVYELTTETMKKIIKHHIGKGNNFIYFILCKRIRMQEKSCKKQMKLNLYLVIFLPLYVAMDLINKEDIEDYDKSQYENSSLDNSSYSDGNSLDSLSNDIQIKQFNLSLFISFINFRTYFILLNFLNYFLFFYNFTLIIIYI